MTRMRVTGGGLNDAGEANAALLLATLCTWAARPENFPRFVSFALEVAGREPATPEWALWFMTTEPGHLQWVAKRLCEGDD